MKDFNPSNDTLASIKELIDEMEYHEIMLQECSNNEDGLSEISARHHTERLAVVYKKINYMLPSHEAYKQFLEKMVDSTTDEAQLELKLEIA